MSNRRTTLKSAPPKRRPRRHLLVIYGALILFGLVLLIAGQSNIVRRPSSAPTETPPSSANNRKTAKNRTNEKATKTASATDQSLLVDDDGKTLWVSPTDGPPLDLAYLPPGIQIMLVSRPKNLLQHADGEKILSALGPNARQAIESLEEMARVSLAQMEQLIVGWQTMSDGELKATLVVHASNPFTLGKLSTMHGQAPTKVGDGEYLILGDRAYYLPSNREAKVLVIAPADTITELIDLGGDPPPLRRDVERLLKYTDADREMTVVVTPNSLFSDGRAMFDGEMSRLRAPLFWFLGDELSAAALSLDWGDNFFVELIATPTLDTRPEQAARIMAARVAEIPDKLEAYVVALQPQPHGRMIVARFPAMIRKLSAYTRSGFDSDHVVLNAYLPAVAGHNLFMGAELTLAEAMSGDGEVASATGPSGLTSDAPSSIQAKLQRRTTLRFSRDTLDAALKQLSQDIDVPIAILGPDLQADGITKNQSFGIDLADKRAEEVLIEILRLANPDKTATGPSDVKQKLVYVIKKGEDGLEQILVTTRASAATRGDALPAAFQEAIP